MNNRRSLADALATDPKKLEFIHGGKLNREIPPPAETKEVAAVEIAAAKPQPKPEPVQQPEEPQAAVAEAPKAEVKLKEAVEVETEDDSAASEETAKRTQPRKSRDRGRGIAAEPKPAAPTLTQAVVPFTTRFRQSTAEALRRASLERKLAGETPNSQQEIVEHCVSAWLRANGYLNARD